MGKRMGPRRSKWTEQSPDTQGCCRCVLSTFFPSCLVPGARNGAELCEVPPGLLWPSQTNREGSLHSLNPSQQLLLAGVGIPLSGVVSSWPCPVPISPDRGLLATPRLRWVQCAVPPNPEQMKKFRSDGLHFCIWEGPPDTGSGILHFSRILCLSSPFCSRLVMPSSGRALHPEEILWLICRMKIWEHTALQNLGGPHFFWDECLISEALLRLKQILFCSLGDVILRTF